MLGRCLLLYGRLQPPHAAAGSSRAEAKPAQSPKAGPGDAAAPAKPRWGGGPFPNKRARRHKCFFDNFPGRQRGLFVRVGPGRGLAAKPQVPPLKSSSARGRWRPRALARAGPGCVCSEGTRSRLHFPHSVSRVGHGLCVWPCVCVWPTPFRGPQGVGWHRLEGPSLLWVWVFQLRSRRKRLL